MVISPDFIILHQKHLKSINLDKLFVAQINASRQGRKKVPKSPKSTHFSENGAILGEIPIKGWFSAPKHRLFENPTDFKKAAQKALEGLQNLEGDFHEILYKVVK